MDNIDDQFSLKWNNFQSNLATGFHDLLQEEMMVDVTLAAEGKFLQAHKIILSVCSPYFKDLFKVNPCKHPIVILKDVGHQEMADMLDFMYRGEANVRQEDLAAFLKLAETLKVKGLAGDKQGDDEPPPPSSQAPRKSSAPQVPKKKKIIETSVFESDDHDPGDTDYNPGGGEPRRKKRRSSPPPKTESVMPSSSSSSAQQPFPLANPKQEMPDPEEIQLIDDNDETNDPLVQLISGQGTKQEHDQQDFDDSNFDNTLEDTGDGSHETDFDMTAGPSNPDESTDQVPQGGVFYNYEITKTCRGRPKIICNGFGFIQKSKYNFRNWVCDKRRERKCMVTCILDRDNGFNISNRRVHTHVPFHLNKTNKTTFDLWALSMAHERAEGKRNSTYDEEGAGSNGTLHEYIGHESSDNGDRQTDSQDSSYVAPAVVIENHAIKQEVDN